MLVPVKELWVGHLDSCIFGSFCDGVRWCFHDAGDIVVQTVRSETGTAWAFHSKKLSHVRRIMMRLSRDVTDIRAGAGGDATGVEGGKGSIGTSEGSKIGVSHGCGGDWIFLL